MVNKIARIVKVLILFTACFALFGIIFDYVKGYYDEYMVEYKGTESHEGIDVVVTIPKNASVKKIAHILHDAGLIKYEQAFVRRKQKDYADGTLSSGTFTLNTGMNTLEMMQAMTLEDDTPQVVNVLTIPEGFTIDQIANRCEEENICTAKEFINAVESVTRYDFPYLADVPAGADVRYRLEGYIFPATYEIYEDTTPESLVKWMLDTFDDYYDEEMKLRTEYLGLTSFDVITKASMIEREAKVPEERKIISGVISNRLEEGMLLQVDPTVLYPLTNGKYDRKEVLFEDLEYESPYNTYLHEGLPIGPICNPGIDCIMAALYPDDHEYLYYKLVDEETGTHKFYQYYDDFLYDE